MIIFFCRYSFSFRWQINIFKLNFIGKRGLRCDVHYHLCIIFFFCNMNVVPDIGVKIIKNRLALINKSCVKFPVIQKKNHHKNTHPHKFDLLCDTNCNDIRVNCDSHRIKNSLKKIKFRLHLCMFKIIIIS